MKTAVLGLISALALQVMTEPAASGVLHTDEALVGQVVLTDSDGQTRHCGGTLIAANIVLTAGHCLQRAGERQPSSPRSISFRFTNRAGLKAEIRAVDAATHPDFFYESAPSRGQIALDVGLVKLAEYAQGPFEKVAERDPDHLHLALRPVVDDAPYDAEPCRTVYEPEGVMVLSCARDFGASGSPVFDLIDEKQRIVGIVSAQGKRDGRPVTLAVAPYAILHDLTWAVRDRGALPAVVPSAAQYFSD